MGLYQFLLHQNQVRDSSCSTNIRRGFSKSQMCLQKILQIIASCPPNETSRESSLNREILVFGENKGLDIDLNMGFCLWPEAEPSECLSACSVADKVFSNSSDVEFGEVLASEKSSSEGECDPKDVGDQFGADTLKIETIGNGSRSVKVSEETNLEAKDEEKQKQESLDGDDEGDVKMTPPLQEEQKLQNNDCFYLLIEAAEVVSGNLKDNKEEVKPPSQAKESEEAEAAKGRRSIAVESSSSKRSSESYGVGHPYEDLKDTSPVVRSKRGRSQMLPSRYRDSIVLAPWKRVARPQGLAAAPTISTKQGSDPRNRDPRL
ncbi:hypothetical protein MANES_11G157000v8 [Manihot esculenta]|uniref:Uncharacterized protein n=2 Tax=Manihot esculenta TaxID=3983 RepID=A0ACB7GWL2_MANES|nr:hypothetical protein MANES_11G157000v8 [Manihot esculenta]KAG8644707.1 hypothetical protein MANES_11G157000v8 [Manihot esculenta]